MIIMFIPMSTSGKQHVCKAGSLETLHHSLGALFLSLGRPATLPPQPQLCLRQHATKHTTHTLNTKYSCCSSQEPGSNEAKQNFDKACSALALFFVNQLMSRQMKKSAENKALTNLNSTFKHSFIAGTWMVLDPLIL